MLGRPNAAPLQTEHATRKSARVWCRGPEQSTRTKKACDFVQKRLRIDQMLQQFGRGYHVEVLRRKRGVVKFSFEHLETQTAYVLDRAGGNVESLRLPSMGPRRFEQTTRTTADIQQSIRLAVAGKVSDDLSQSAFDERRRRKLVIIQVKAVVEVTA